MQQKKAGGNKDDPEGYDGIKKMQHTALKKRKNEEQLQEDKEKMEKDAKFLEDLFQENLSEDTERQTKVRNQQAEQIRKEVKGNTEMGQKFIKHLKLPEFDANEEPSKVKFDVLNQEDKAI